LFAAGTPDGGPQLSSVWICDYSSFVGVLLKLVVICESVLRFSGDSELCRVSSGWITSPSLSEFGGS